MGNSNKLVERTTQHPKFQTVKITDRYGIKSEMIVNKTVPPHIKF